MVENGHVTQPAAVVEFGFSNPDRAQLGIEVLSYALLKSRITEKMLTSVHRTDFHQIFAITGGSGVVMVDFEDHHCPAGTLLHVSPGRVLRLPRPADPSGVLDALMVLFTPSFPPRLEHARTLLGPFGPVRHAPPPAERAGLARCLAALRTEYARAVRDTDSTPITTEVLRHLLAALLLHIARLPTPDGLRPGPDDTHGDTFQRFQQELERSFATNRNATDYAARIGYSSRSLNRACQAATGHTAKALIDSRVALEAKRLLAHTNLPVAAISHRLGFTEPTNFGKFFTRETGHTPGAFRAQERR
jgi:AraC-like DNA-binding protein